MSRPSSSRRHTELSYKVRIMGGVVAAQLLCLALILFWPVPAPEHTTLHFTDNDEPLVLEAPVITRQQGAPPPPPAPQVPVPVPNDEVVEQEVELPKVNLSQITDPLKAGVGEEGSATGEIAGSPQTPPQVMRIVEPTFENRTPNKADIYVKFLVNKEGRVEKADISRIVLYDEEGNPTREVAQIADRVVQATLQAAMDWKFRPAQENGEPVRAYSTQIFIVDY